MLCIIANGSDKLKNCHGTTYLGRRLEERGIYSTINKIMAIITRWQHLQPLRLTMQPQAPLGPRCPGNRHVRTQKPAAAGSCKMRGRLLRLRVLLGFTQSPRHGRTVARSTRSPRGCARPHVRRSKNLSFSTKALYLSQ
jgi:hypothetical protein